MFGLGHVEALGKAVVLFFIESTSLYQKHEDLTWAI